MKLNPVNGSLPDKLDDLAFTLQHHIVEYQPLYQFTEYAHSVITFYNLTIITIMSCVLLNFVHQSLMVNLYDL